MILVFVLLAIIILLLLFTYIILFSTLNIQISDLSFANYPKKQKGQYKILISLRLWNRFKWLWFDVDKKKVKKLWDKIPMQKIDIQKIEKDFMMHDFKLLKKLHLQIAAFHMKAEVGLESPIVTSFLIAVASSLLSILLANTAKNIKENQYSYSICPIYQNKNLYKILLNCIIELKMVHIINVIYILFKKGKSDENERTTSNRKSYGYSYE